MNIRLSKLSVEDLDDYYMLNHPSQSFHRFNGPYFKKETEEELRDKIERWRLGFESGNSPVLDNRMIIRDSETEDLIGEVSWYWKSQETNWLEVGIVIYNEDYWGRGIGYVALEKWINHMFTKFPSIVRIGLTTWSGNHRMMGLAEKMGMELEAKYRKARIVDGEYYDSISYGILKSEWTKKED